MSMNTIEIGCAIKVSSYHCVRDEIKARRNEQGDYSDQIELVYIGRYDYLIPKDGFGYDTIDRFVKSSLNIVSSEPVRYIKRNGRYRVK